MLSGGVISPLPTTVDVLATTTSTAAPNASTSRSPFLISLAPFEVDAADSHRRPDRFDEPIRAFTRTQHMRRRTSVVRSVPVARDLAHLSDEAIVALVARSDETALAELYDRFGRVAYGLAVRMLRDQSLAEDAVQEGFLSVWRNASRVVPE